MRKARETRSLDNDQLHTEEQRLRKLLFDLRNKAVRGKPEKTHEMRQARRELAQVLTVINERRKGAAVATPAA
jgi:ribosomal protein L29